MKQYPFPQNRGTIAAFGLLLFGLLLLARDTIISSVIVGFYQSQFLMLALMGLMGAAFLLTAFLDVPVLAVIFGCAVFGLITSVIAERRNKA